MDADLWVSNNVKVGWIGEALRLPLAEALVPIAAQALADGAAYERARIRRELIEDFHLAFGDGHETSHLVATLDRICKEG